MGIWSKIKGLFGSKRQAYSVDGKVLLLSKKEYAAYMAKHIEEQKAKESQRAKIIEKLNNLVVGSIFLGDNFTYFPDDDKCGCTVIFETNGSVQIEHIIFKPQPPKYVPSSLLNKKDKDPYCIGDNTRFSIRPKKNADKETPKIDPEALEKQAELNSKLDAFRKMAEELRRMGASEDALASVLAPKQDIGRLLITGDYKIILPKYENKEVMLRPLPKALYLLFLKHPEGIAFKDLADYKDELFDIYNHITTRWQYDINAKSIETLIDPTNNSINEKCSRIYKAFVDTVGKSVADKLAIKGKRGETRTIDFDRGKVDWE